ALVEEALGELGGEARRVAPAAPLRRRVARPDPAAVRRAGAGTRERDRLAAALPEAEDAVRRAQALGENARQPFVVVPLVCERLVLEGAQACPDQGAVALV